MCCVVVGAWFIRLPAHQTSNQYLPKSRDLGNETLLYKNETELFITVVHLEPFEVACKVTGLAHQESTNCYSVRC